MNSTNGIMPRQPRPLAWHPPGGHVRQQGFSMIEMLISVAIGLMVTATVLYTVSGSGISGRKQNVQSTIHDLGNPTDQHAHDRHNAGFWFIDALLRHYPGQMRPDAKFLGDVGEVRIGAQVVRLLKPMTYMNRSGQSVGALARFYRLEPADILIAYDELDLMPGSARLKLGGSSTHNGLRDITAHLGTPRYWRLRLGIGHPRSLNLNKSVVDFVLGKPSQSDQQLIDQAIDRSVDHLPILMRDGWEIATQQLHSADPAMQQAKAARKGSPEAKPTDSL